MSSGPAANMQKSVSLWPDGLNLALLLPLANQQGEEKRITGSIWSSNMVSGPAAQVPDSVPLALGSLRHELVLPLVYAWGCQAGDDRTVAVIGQSKMLLWLL